ncbi:MAG: neutral zinc metallopeptidase [Dermatophilaceae bacterium]
MTFNEDVHLDTSQVESGGGSGGGRFPGGLPVGGGIGGLILLILVLVFGGNVLNGGDTTESPDQSVPGQSSSLDAGQVEPGGQQSNAGFTQCKTGADANKNDECLIIATVNSAQSYWGQLLPQYGKRYTPAKTVIYSGATQSQCGTASNQVGPFYCPLDGKVYIDASFFQELRTRFGADRGNLAKEYVIAHEYGHHIQDQLGLLGKAQQDAQGPQSGSVRLELMADCLAGTWVKHASETTDANGTTFLKPISAQDIQSALSAASAVGDDRIQQATAGRVAPETWTHGSSEARQRWFMTGYQTGDINRCDTFAVPSV